MSTPSHEKQSSRSNRGTPSHALQDPETRIIYVITIDSELGQAYAQLNDKDEKLAFMRQHGRNTGTVPAAGEPGNTNTRGEGMSEEVRARILEMKAAGLMPGVDKDGNVVTQEDVWRKMKEAKEGFSGNLVGGV